MPHTPSGTNIALPVLDEPREHCGVFATWGAHNPARLAYYALFALQHRGQESAGIVATDGTILHRHSDMGLVANVFTNEHLDALDEVAASRPDRTGGVIAHNRYSTTGVSSPENAQPFVGQFAAGALAIAHNGNITNAHMLRKELEEAGAAFHSSSDTEVVLHVIAHEAARGAPDPLAAAMDRLEGAFCFVLLSRDRVEVVRDRHGWRPLVLGRTESGAPVVASETVALDVIGATYEREVEPGEILTLTDEGTSSRRFAQPAERLAHCVFEHVYFASPASRVFGSTVQMIRERLGETLWDEAPVAADIVLPMPDSGRSAATGFARASGYPYREGIIPNRYVGRTFIKPTDEERVSAVRLKLNVIAEIVRDRRIVVVDDSVVRGTTTRAKMDQLRKAGAKEIHLRISCPPIRHACYFGVDFPDVQQLVATGRTIEQIRQLLGVDSLAYLSLDGLLRCVSTPDVPADRYCTACYSGEYPIEVDPALRKEVFAKNC